MLCIYLDRAIEADEEILHNYGDLSDGELLSIYGFIGSSESERNPHGTVALPFDDIVDCCHFIAQQEVNGHASTWLCPTSYPLHVTFQGSPFRLDDVPLPRLHTVQGHAPVSSELVLNTLLGCQDWHVGMSSDRRELLHGQGLGSNSTGALCLVSAGNPLPDSLLTIVQVGCIVG